MAYPWTTLTGAVATSLATAAMAWFSYRLWRLEKSRDFVELALLNVRAVEKGRYQILVANRGARDCAIENVWYRVHVRNGGDMPLQGALWVRRTMKEVKQARGLGLMIRSGERLWFTVKCFDEPDLAAAAAGVSIYFRGVLEPDGAELTSGHWIRLQGASVSSPGTTPEVLDDAVGEQ